MGFDGIVRNAVAVANSLTADLQATVTHRAFSSADAYGKPTYGSAVSRKALMESKRRLIRTEGGQETMSRAKVTFLSPVTVTVKDKITLPDGTTGPILDIHSLVDPDSTTGKGYFIEVWLG